MKDIIKIIGISLSIAALMLSVIQLCFRLRHLFCRVAGVEEEDPECWPV